MSDTRSQVWRPEEPLRYGDLEFAAIVLIGNHDPNAGLSVLMTYALNGIRKALERNWLPVINFDHQVHSYFYQASLGTNVWEYFWEPVYGVSLESVLALRESGAISPEQIKSFSKQEMADWHQRDPSRIGTFWNSTRPANPDAWMRASRRRAQEMYSRYIHIRSSIVRKAELFAAENFNSDYLFTAHVRSTDFAHAAATPVKRYFDKLDELVSEKNLLHYRVFLATDQEQIVQLFQEQYGRKLVTYNANRSRTDVAAYKDSSISGYRKGEDVLVDIMLLARGDHLLKCAASAGEFAIWMNPSLEFTDFTVESNSQSRDRVPLTGYELIVLEDVSPLRKSAYRARYRIQAILEKEGRDKDSVISQALVLIRYFMRKSYRLARRYAVQIVKRMFF